MEDGIEDGIEDDDEELDIVELDATKSEGMKDDDINQSKIIEHIEIEQMIDEYKFVKNDKYQYYDIGKAIKSRCIGSQTMDELFNIIKITLLNKDILSVKQKASINIYLDSSNTKQKK